MTDTPLYADLVALGGGCWEGPVVGHPSPTTKLRVQMLTSSERSAGLWDGPHFVGHGILRREADGTWRGFCHEYAGRWELEAQQGSGRVRFAEVAA